jgi:long-chain acyl-CoA synthetase
MHFAKLPDDRAHRKPDLPALADQHIGRLGNAQVLAWVEVTADRLSAAGVRPGDVVAVMLPSRVEFVIALFAAWRLRAAVTSVNPAMTPGEVSHQLVDSGARILVCEASAEVTGSGPAVVSVPLLPKKIRVRPRQRPDYRDEDLALLVYTSGSTGRPKGVELTHRNVMAMCTSMLSLMDDEPDLHSLLILPLFHVNGIVIGVLTPLLADGQATLAGRFSPSTFFTILEQARPTFFSAVPAIFAMLAELPPDVRPDTRSVRFAVCGAAPMPPELLTRFENRYGITIVEGYGLSEATCVSTTNPLHGVRKPGSVGIALPEHEVATMNAAGELITDGSPGEVVIKGPTVMRGYLNRPQDTAKAIIDGWLHTGDIGRIDSDGYLTLVDRVKDIISAAVRTSTRKRSNPLSTAAPTSSRRRWWADPTRCTARFPSLSCRYARIRTDRWSRYSSIWKSIWPVTNCPTRSSPSTRSQRIRWARSTNPASEGVSRRRRTNPVQLR